ncbi:MAG: hypothetical protein QM793_05320 [Muricomes sp.]
MKQKKAEKMLRTMAAREGVSVHTVRAQIQKAIDIGMSDPDPLVKAFWDNIPHKGERPSPEEVICFLGEKALERQN